MSKRNELVILAVLLAVLVVVAYTRFRPAGADDSGVPATATVEAMRVANPSLHIDRLDRIRRAGYSGSHRNIFSAAPLPAPAAGRESKTPDASYIDKPAGPPVPPPLQVPLTFYGMAVDTKTGRQLAFFTSGEEVYIARVGETLLGRFRLIRIGSDTAVFEEISTGRQATIPMTPLENPPSGTGGPGSP